MNGANANRHLFLSHILDKNCSCFFCCFREKMSWLKKITWFAHINITASYKYERFVLWSVHYKDSPNINSCVFITLCLQKSMGSKRYFLRRCIFCSKCNDRIMVFIQASKIIWIHTRGGSRTAATSKIACLPLITECFILDIAAVLDRPLRQRNCNIWIRERRIRHQNESLHYTVWLWEMKYCFFVKA